MIGDKKIIQILLKKTLRNIDFFGKITHMLHSKVYFNEFSTFNFDFACTVMLSIIDLNFNLEMTKICRDIGRAK